MRRTALGAVVLSVLVASYGAGCSKTKESLIVVQLVAERAAPYPIVSVTLTGSGRTQTYPVDGLSTDRDNPTTLGLYVDDTGSVDVAAVARPGSGRCDGFTGSGHANIKEGDTKTIAILLKSANVCNVTGAGGHGGSTGQGGHGATGGSGPVCTGTQQPVNVPPTLACCTTYDHADLPSGTDCDDNDTYVYTAAFSPDGSLVMTGGDDGRVLFWTYDGQRLQLEGHYVDQARYGYAAFSPDGTLVAIGGNQVVDVYYVTGAKAWTLAAPLDVAGVVYGVAFTPDSKRVITVDSTPNIYVHDLTHPAALFQAAIPVGEPYGVAVSRTLLGNVLGVAVPDAQGMTAVYGVNETGIGPASTIDTSSQAIWGGCFSPTGTSLVLTEVDALARFYDYPSLAPAGNPIDIGNDDDVRGCAFSPNGNYVALVGGWFQGSASIWDAASRAMISRYDFLDGRVNGLSVGFAPAGNALVVGGMGCGKVLLCRE